ncbi:MAG TPA: SRPBCC family protein [Nocardioidaceae bacterium]|nr:SRPBCC family protein [Nocardioidaceae bacterium]
MISVSSTVQVNPPDEPIRLTRADVWHGLALKAENALPFVPAMTVCEVKERTDTEIVREIEFRGQRFGERITLVPEQTVQFDRTFGPVMGTIRNEILEEDGDLSLRFTFDLVLEGVAAGSDAEREYEATMKGDYLKAAGATLAATRRMVAERDPAGSTAP